VLGGSLEGTFSEGAGCHSSGTAISLGFLRITERFWAGIQCKIYMYIYIYIYVCMYVCVCVRIHTHTHTHTYYIYIYIDVFPNAQPSPQSSI
jgi:hypothetical protein